MIYEMMHICVKLTFPNLTSHKRDTTDASITGFISSIFPLFDNEIESCIIRIEM